MCDMSGNSSREKTTEWLEDVLETYFTYKKKIKCIPGDSVDPVSVSVVDFDIGPGFAGDTRISTLSDLLALQVRFKVGWHLFVFGLTCATILFGNFRV